MTATADYGTTTVAPSIRVGAGAGAALPDSAAQRLVRAVTDTHLHLPGMFEITFVDDTGDLATTSGLTIGTAVTIGTSEDPVAPALLKGEITAIEARCENLHSYTLVRGYDLTHRLQRARRTRTFLDTTDSDVATQLARAAGLVELAVDPSPVVHAHLGQCDQTDWEFLQARAREIGWETGIEGGVFYFRAASSVTTATGEPVALAFPAGLRAFRPRLTAGTLAPAVDVRVWDPLRATVVAGTASTASGTASLTGHTPAALASTFVHDSPPAAAAQPGAPAVADLGPAPGTTAYVVYDRPLATGAAIDASADAVARATAEHLGSVFAEAEGEAEGDPRLLPGRVASVSGVPAPFSGSWLVTSARHVFDLREGGYTTRFAVSGRQERSLLGLASGGEGRPRAPRLPGVYCGVVSNNNDALAKGRVKVVLPWLSPDYESDWASVVQFGAGRRSGAMFLPEVGDEVLVGFEFGDARRPWVLGGVVTNASSYSLGTPPVKAVGEAAAVVARGFVSGAGNRLVFRDELPPGDAESPPTTSSITLGTGDGTLALEIDQVAGTVTLSCSPKPPGSKAEAGTLTIRCGDGGTVNVAAGPGGSVTIDGGGALTLKASDSISIQSSGEVALKGSKITLN